MMRVIAPGKLLLSGAYAVLEGAPAIVCAIDRHAIATRTENAGEPTAEVRAALEHPPSVDTRALAADDGAKLGLGSSAAALVAALALDAVERGEDLATPEVLENIFRRARDVHARVQGGGSGFDVAASTFGGVLRYRALTGGAEHVRVELPATIHLEVFFSGTSARTSALRDRVDALRTRDAREHAARMKELATIADAASSSIGAADPRAFIDAIAASVGALAALGAAADAPIVPPTFAELARCARREAAAFVPSGAGGGDVGAFVGTSAPSPSFMQEAAHANMRHLSLRVDPRGARIAERET